MSQLKTGMLSYQAIGWPQPQWEPGRTTDSPFGMR